MESGGGRASGVKAGFNFRSVSANCWTRGSNNLFYSHTEDKVGTAFKTRYLDWPRPLKPRCPVESFAAEWLLYLFTLQETGGGKSTKCLAGIPEPRRGGFGRDGWLHRCKPAWNKYSWLLFLIGTNKIVPPLLLCFTVIVEGGARAICAHAAAITGGVSNNPS